MTTLYTSRKKLTRTISVGPVSERNVFTEESLITDASDEDSDVRSSVGDHRMLIRKQLSAPSQYNEHKNQKKRRSQQTGIGDFLHSLFSSKKRQDQVRVINKKNLHMSCPNLNSQDRFDEHLQLDKDEVNESRNSKRSSSAKYSMSSRNKSPESCACDTLKVPDIFVTSLTRSRSDDTCQSGISFTLKQENKHLSTSNLHDTAVSRRLLLTSSESNSLSCSEENIARITPYLYVGRVEAANDQRLLCKLDIHSLVDITNLKSSQHISLACPCTCSKEGSHAHPKLYVNVDSTDHNRIQDHFPMINKFINGSKELGRATLIYSEHSRVRAPVAAIQYLITCQGMCLQDAYSIVKSRWPATLIDQNFQKIFSKLNRIQLELSKYRIETRRINKDLSSSRLKVKTAWAEQST
ncbi:uncharacterized protein LOC118766471 [Octopus sinensis]|uniref:protein-tyrosine-phosphatase n=1 Tax=Octopus sinensis TaxID=2607531 RepID=A0A7E6FEG7_9MOLL|nr:uncharacterized protein LOC118766471 [Octopus sinensis]XP_036365735.1 uncharacterized protein LOC118766471 [Octopus sinensis]